MQTYNAEFQGKNQAVRKDPRYILEIYGDTNTYYILSNSDIDIPGVSSSYIIQSSFEKSSVKSQVLRSIDSTSDIGKMSFEVVDINSAFTNMLAAVDALGESLRGRKMVFYYGYKGLDFTPLTGGNYIKIQTQIIHDSLGHDGTSYKLNSRDVQRTLIENIFTPKVTTLMSSITRTATQIPAQLVTNFQTLTHTASFTDAPSETVGYFRIQDEVIRWTAKDAGTDYFTVDNVTTILSTTTAVNDTTVDIADITGFATSGIGYIDDGANISEIKWTGLTANSPGPSGTLTGVTGVKYAHVTGSPEVQVVYSKGRGVFNTVAVAHEVDSGITDDDRKPQITEWIYLEMPALQMALSVMTGVIYGNSPEISLPSHWSPQISVDWIATSIFENIGTDIYDPTDNTSGLILRFDGLKTQNCLSWLQEQIYKPCLVFDYILADGQIAIKRLTESLEESPYLRKLDDSQLVELTNLRQDYNDVYNEFEIFWSWNALTEEFTRRLLLSDDDSKTKMGLARRLTIKLYGLHGSRHTDAVIIQWLDGWRSRHSGAPWKGDIKIKLLNSDLEIGDPVLVDTDFYRDHLADTVSRFSRTMELRSISFDPNNGEFKGEVFGSTQRASPLNLGAQSAVLDASYYTATGTDLSTQTTYFTDVSGVLHCDTNGYTMTGQTSINNTSAHYYVDGDLTIDPSIGITFTQNVLLKVNGTLTINGYMTGAGQGIAGVAFSGTGVGGTSGFFGITKGGGGLFLASSQSVDGTLQYVNFGNRDAIVTQGDNSNPPRLNLVNNSGQLVFSAGGAFDLRPTSGGSGKPYTTRVTGAIPPIGGNGGDGGAGGASLVIVCKGLAWGASGYIDTSGSAGTDGDVVTLSGGNAPRVAGGKGASGHPGAVWVLLDGNTVNQPNNKLIAYSQSTKGPGNIIPIPEGPAEMGGAINSSGYYDDAINRNQTCFIVQRIPDNLTAVEDPVETATTSSAININLVSGNANLVNVNVYEITTTAPADTAWKADAIYWRKQGAEDWTRIGTTNSTNELTFYAGISVGTLEFKAHPISVSNIESPDYIETTLTVSTTVTTTLGTGGKLLIGSATDYFTGNGIALVDDAGTAKWHTGNPAGQYVRWTGSALDVKGNITADTISADSGTVGGWTLGANDLSATNIWLNSASKYLAINSQTFAASGIQIEYNAGSPRFYVGDGSTEYLKYSGGNVEIGGGTLSETVYEIYTSGLIRNNASPSTNGGFQLDNSYFRTWNTASPIQMTYELDFSDGSFFAGNDTDNKYIKYDATANVLTVATLQTASSGKRIELNPSLDNELHFYGDRGDTTIEELATIGITASGSDSVIANFGTLNSGNIKVAVKAHSYGRKAIYGESYQDKGVTGASNDDNGVYGTSQTTTGVQGVSNAVSGTTAGVAGTGGSWGGYFYSGAQGPLRLGVDASASAPTHSAAIGTLWVTSAGVLYINTSGSTTWAKVGAQ